MLPLGLRGWGANALWFYGAQSPLCQSLLISWRETARPASPLQTMVTCVYIFRSLLVRQKNLKYFDVSLLEFFNLRLVYWPQISRSARYRSERYVYAVCMRWRRSSQFREQIDVCAVTDTLKKEQIQVYFYSLKNATKHSRCYSTKCLCIFNFVPK